jgi:parvulin-like peptidyl-prolyl isomerase
MFVAITLTAQTQKNPKGIVGKINNKTYTYSEYNDILNNYFNYWQTRDGKKLTPERKKELNDRCWEELIGRSIYDSEIKRRNIIVTDQEAKNSVLKDPPMQIKQIEALKTNGKFDIEKLKKALEVDEKFRVSVYNLVKETMVYDKLFNVIKAQVKAKPDSIKNVWLKDNNTADAKVIFFDYTTLPIQEVSDNEALESYNTNMEKYKKQPARKYKYVKVNSDQYYKVKADSIYNQLINDADFADLAKKFSDDPGSGQNGGDLGWFGKGRMVTAFEDAAYALQINEISKPVKSRFGWHIIQTLDKKNNENNEEEVHARHILIKTEVRESDKAQIQTNADNLFTMAKAEGLQRAATKMGYTIEETREFYEADKSVPDIGQYPELITEAFSHSIGYMPQNVVSKTGEVFVCELSDSLGIHYSPFDKEKNGIVRTLEREKRISLNKSKARDFYNLNKGTDYIAIAERDSMKIVDAISVKEDTNIPGLNFMKPLNEALLTAEEGQYTNLIENDTNAYLALVKKRVKPNLANWEKQKTKLIAEADKKLKDKQLNDWYYKQRQKNKIEDNRKDFYELTAQNNMQQIQINPN